MEGKTGHGVPKNQMGIETKPTLYLIEETFFLQLNSQQQARLAGRNRGREKMVEELVRSLRLPSFFL